MQTFRQRLGTAVL